MNFSRTPKRILADYIVREDAENYRHDGLVYGEQMARMEYSSYMSNFYHDQLAQVLRTYAARRGLTARTYEPCEPIYVLSDVRKHN